jgi:hypothetical protein
MLLIEPSFIRLMPRHPDTCVINIFLIQILLQVDYRVFKSFRISYTTLAFCVLQLAYLIRYSVCRVHLHPHHNRWIPNPLNEHMDLDQAILRA